MAKHSPKPWYTETQAHALTHIQIIDSLSPLTLNWFDSTNRISYLNDWQPFSEALLELLKLLWDWGFNTPWALPTVCGDWNLIHEQAGPSMKRPHRLLFNVLILSTRNDSKNMHYSCANSETVLETDLSRTLLFVSGFRIRPKGTHFDWAEGTLTISPRVTAEHLSHLQMSAFRYHSP